MSKAERTISGTLNWGTRLLRRRGIETPRVNAELLLRKALGIDPVEVYLYKDRVLTQPQFASYVASTAKGYLPVAVCSR